MYTEHYGVCVCVRVCTLTCTHTFMYKYCTPSRESLILFICTIFIIYIFSEPLLKQQFPALQKLTQLSFC